ncbi:MAG TPA: SUMF1/EgtB/PvdO family nonheme iron enzyme [Tenuifilaceae bacterium]|nr:SUMF1/EgtB/PvdO family nonheme iron enzyme [Tenuifilaceae bacterium]
MQKIIITSLLLLLSSLCFSNNLQLKNGSLHENVISFEISWNNCWNHTNNDGNYDAAWIFVKGKLANGEWKHLDLSNNSNSHQTSGSVNLELPTDCKGVFALSTNYGTFSSISSTISLEIDDISDIQVIEVYAIEMVHISEGEFYVGDGASISSIGDSQGEPFLVDSENEITGTSLSIVNPNTYFTPESLPETIPTTFPKGFKGFYVMKYEVSQIQYVDFLNTLSYNQQTNRTSISPNAETGTYAMINHNQPDSLYRNGIVIVTPGEENGAPAVYGINANGNQSFNEDSDGLNRAANFLSWADLAAYLDWAALRPISEFEFEKICRGSGNEATTGEFSWGSSEVTNANTPVNDGTVFETVSENASSGSGLANHGNTVASQGWGLRGVLRTGFAATENSTRMEAGAGFYGVMELSGNVWEQTVMAAGEGVLFNGNFGDGQVDENGNANVEGWCNNSTANGVILRGGGWGSTVSEVGSYRDLAVSDRFYSHLKPINRRNTVGGRGAR